MSSLGKIADIINSLNMTTSDVLTEQAEVTSELNQRSNDLQKDALAKTTQAVGMTKEIQTYASIGGSIASLTMGFTGVSTAGSALGVLARNNMSPSTSFSKYGPMVSIVLAFGALITGVLSTTCEGKTATDLQIVAGTLGAASLASMMAFSAEKMEPGTGIKGFGSAMMQQSARASTTLAQPLTGLGTSGFQVAQGIVQSKLAGVEKDLEHDFVDSTTSGSGAKTTQKAMSSGFQLQETLQKTFQMIVREEAEALTHNKK